MNSERPRSKWRTAGFYLSYYAIYTLAALLISLTVVLFLAFLGVDVPSTFVSIPVFFVIGFYAQVKLNERNNKREDSLGRHL